MYVRKNLATRWIWVCAWTFSIYLSLPFSQAPTIFLRGQGLLTYSVAILFCLVGGILFYLLWIRCGERRPWIYLLFVFVSGACGVLVKMMSRPEETMHFLQYGVLGWLFLSALDGAVGASSFWSCSNAVLRFCLAALCVALLGWLDEGIQYFLPSRVYDMRDVYFNALGGLLGAMVRSIVTWGPKSSSGGELPCKV